MPWEKRMPRVLVPLAKGCEEMEVVTIVDILRRAGAAVVLAQLEEGPVGGAHGLVLQGDTTLDKVLNETFDMLVLPGGTEGSRRLGEDTRIAAKAQQMAHDNQLLTAICAAPGVLAKAGLLDGKKAACYPTCLDAFPAVQQELQPVVRDGQFITSRGPATAVAFALHLTEALFGPEKRKEVARQILCPES
ncbi:MAG: DJ-1/PfpI family protein [Cystobacterineae bacterium]|nr:DJ-1/PfpI family protein [Cystobacterineae bacterium]